MIYEAAAPRQVSFGCVLYIAKPRSYLHLMEVDDPTELFPISTITLGLATGKVANLDQRRESRKAKRDAGALAAPVPLPPNAGKSSEL